jgi:hypothetical protein
MLFSYLDMLLTLVVAPMIAASRQNTATARLLAYFATVVATFLGGVVAGGIAMAVAPADTGMTELAGLGGTILVTIIVALARSETKTCPHCRSQIHPHATRCPKCQAELGAEAAREWMAREKARTTDVRLFPSGRDVRYGFIGLTAVIIAIVGAYLVSWGAEALSNRGRPDSSGPVAISEKGESTLPSRVLAGLQDAKRAVNATAERYNGKWSGDMTLQASNCIGFAPSYREELTIYVNNSGVGRLTATANAIREYSIAILSTRSFTSKQAFASFRLVGEVAVTLTSDTTMEYQETTISQRSRYGETGLWIQESCSNTYRGSLTKQ